MSIATSVDAYLARSGVDYDLVAHDRTSTSSQSAQAAHISGDKLAKCVMLQDDSGYVMAILPASHRLDMAALDEQLGRSLSLADEDELKGMFADCEPGAMPPLGRAYGVEAVVDDGLLKVEDVYFEAGDHLALVHVSGMDFLKLMGNAKLLTISQRH